MDDRGERAIADQIAYYRARAPEYDEEFRGAHDPMLVAAVAAARPRGRVLELACGTGAWTRSLITHPVASILAVYAASEMLAVHGERIHDARVERLQADLFRWEPPERYDFVTFAFWLSHVPPARFRAFWDMVRGAVADGGRVFFADQDQRGLAFEQPSADADYPIVPRELQDGRVMSAIKVYHQPAELRASLEILGWETRIEPVPGGFFWAEARPATG
jgi:demethylmenaquinone methyltransferase/2-methoxy-6-polyprenyl-1,4-benzoquinol methylase